jgi:hypothetical protein
MVAHQNAALAPVLDAPDVSGPPIEDKLLPMWRRPLAVDCTTFCLSPRSVDDHYRCFYIRLLVITDPSAALQQAACSVPVYVWLPLGL